MVFFLGGERGGVGWELADYSVIVQILSRYIHCSDQGWANFLLCGPQRVLALDTDRQEQMDGVLG